MVCIGEHMKGCHGNGSGALQEEHDSSQYGVLRRRCKGIYMPSRSHSSIVIISI